MKSILCAFMMLTGVVGLASAQKQAQPDNGQFITVAQTTGANHQTHYTLTNKNTVTMDFTLYKEVKGGSWDVTRHLNLQPGEAYDDVNSFTGLTGRYLVYSAPHSDWASFPSSFDMAKIQASGTGPAPATAATPTPGAAAPGAPSTSAPAQQAPSNDAPATNSSMNKDSAPTPPPPSL